MIVIVVCVVGRQAGKQADSLMKCCILSNKQWALNFHLILFTVVLLFRFYSVSFSSPPVQLEYTKFGTRFGIRNFFLLFSFVSVQSIFSLSRSLSALVASIDCDLRLCVNVNYAFYCQKDFWVVLSWLQKCAFIKTRMNAPIKNQPHKQQQQQQQ